ncbi:MAG: cold shock domain-containing protein [bacterium]|jgi:CspA family cold shock protein
MTQRYIGRVKWFNATKGFGFIEHPGNQDVFVHFTEIVGNGYRELTEGEEVEFSLKDTPRGSQAVQVVRLGRR